MGEKCRIYLDFYVKCLCDNLTDRWHKLLGSLLVLRYCDKGNHAFSTNQNGRFLKAPLKTFEAFNDCIKYMQNLAPAAWLSGSGDLRFQCVEICLLQLRIHFMNLHFGPKTFRTNFCPRISEKCQPESNRCFP
jgi:hypothetical protein